MPDNVIIEDRGDEPTPEQLEQLNRERDEKGRFVKTSQGEGGGEEEEETPPEEEQEETEEEEAEPPKKKKEPAKKDGEEETEEEEENEEENEEEEETPPEEETDVEDTEAGKMVTLKRFKEVIRQRKELQAKLDEQAAAKKDVKATDSDATAQIKAFNDRLDDLYVKVEEARVAEDAPLAAKLQREIDSMNRQVTNAEAAMTARREAFIVQENRAYNQMLDYLETVRPILDPDAPEFDKRVVKELTFHVEAYEKMGLTATSALQKAAQMIFEQDPFAKDVKKVLETEEEDPKKKKAPEPKKTDVKKNIAAAKKTPPGHTGRTQEESGKINVVNLSDEEFDKLPESKKRELRGDAV